MIKDDIIKNYARRCKKKIGCERFKMLHGADNIQTFCGKELDEMWFLESGCGMEPADITCPKCIRALKNKSKEASGELHG